MHPSILTLIILTLSTWFGLAHGQSYPSRSSGNYSRAQPPGQELQYLSAECSRLYDVIRTAPARGLKNDTVRTLQKEFEEKCSEEVSAAHQKLNNSQRDKKMTEQEEKMSAQKQTALSKEEEARKFRQCAEMRNALSNRKARANPTEGEKNDVLVFEQRYRERCS
jgi:hypothetical protein